MLSNSCSYCVFGITVLEEKVEGGLSIQTFSLFFFHTYQIYLVYDSNILKSSSFRTLNYHMPSVSATLPTEMFHDLKGYFKIWNQQNKMFWSFVSKITVHYLEINEYSLKMWKCCVITKFWKQLHKFGKCKKERFPIYIYITTLFFLFFLLSDFSLHFSGVITFA